MKSSTFDVQHPIFFPALIFCVFLFLFLLEMTTTLSAAGITTIRILKKAEINSDKIILGKIANIKGGNQGFVQKLRRIVIGKAPLPGNSRRIDERYIKIRLKQNDIDLSQIILHVPQQIEISRSFFEVPQEEIEKAVLDFIYEKIPWDRNRVRVNNVRVSQKVVLPKGNFTCKVVPPKDTDFLGTIPLSINFNVNGSFQKKIRATVNIGVLTDVVVTKRPLGRYKPITEDDIHLKKMDMANLPSNSITRCEDVLGKRTKRTINANVVLRTDFIEIPPLVRRGDLVLIIAESDNLKITALGEVKQKGCRGERIRVVNLDSEKGIYARILDSNTVKVDF